MNIPSDLKPSLLFARKLQARDEADPWRAEAACLGVDTNIFYAAGEGSREDDILTGRALRFCARCPVRDDCLAAAVRDEEGYRDPATNRWRRASPKRCERWPHSLPTSR